MASREPTDLDSGTFGTEPGIVSAGGQKRAKRKTSTGPAERRRLFGPTLSTRLWISSTPRGWELPIDALVVPAHPGIDLSGGLARALRKESSTAWAAVESELRDRLGERPLESHRPVFVRPPEGSPLPGHLVFATAWDERLADRASPAGIDRAVRAVVDGCRIRGIKRLALPLLGAGAGGVNTDLAVHSLVSAAIASLGGNGLGELTFVVTDPAIHSELLGYFQRLPQRFANDVAAGEDLLDVAGEVQALTDILLLRSLEPPMTVGILGGWGTGKSFVFHLMKRHLRRLRARPVDSASAWSEASPDPYVGHVYPITFDAWTYAKSNLWASLMQTIFLELSRQVTLERKIREALGKGSSESDAEREGRLWAAFQEIDESDRETILDLPGLAPRFADISSDRSMLDPDAGKVLWETVASVKAEQRDVLAGKRRERARVEDDIERERAGVHREVEQEIQDEAYRQAWSEAAAGLRELVRAQVAGSSAEGTSALDDEWRQLKAFHHAGLAELDRWSRRWTSLRRMAREAPRLTLTMAAGSVFLLVASAALAHSTEGLAQAASFITALSALAAPLLMAERATRTLRRRLGAAWDRLDERLRSAEERLGQERQRRLEERLERPRGRLGILERERRELDSEIEWLERQIGFTARYVSVADLVGARLETADYEGELGLMHRVQRDLDELSQALTRPAGHPHRKELEESFPRGPARVVLFIDDLDRCPPHRVVEVLEAAQLLVKTRLFVVVVALDQRYVTRALERVYRGVLRRGGSPCGLDYVEKIIQLPYSIRPIDPESLDRFLRGQMEVVAESSPGDEGNGSTGAGGADDGTSGPARAPEHGATDAPVSPEVLTFDSEELLWIREASSRVDLSPRSLKRVVNAFKLLKIVWYRPSRHPRPDREVQHSFVTILVLSAAFPLVFRRLFEEFSRRLASSIDEAIFADEARALLDGDLPTEERRDAEALLPLLDLLPGGGRIPTTSRTTLELVRSLSFVVDL